MENNKYLPIGTVVLLKEATKTIMITGYLPTEEGKNNKIYDYIGCLYPEGYLSSDQNLLFNQNQIDKVFFVGYETEEQPEFYKELEQAKMEFTQLEDDIEVL